MWCTVSASVLALLLVPHDLSAQVNDFAQKANDAFTQGARSVRVPDGDQTTFTVLQVPLGAVLTFGVGTYVVGGIICADSTTENRDSCLVEGVSPSKSIVRLAPHAGHDLLTNLHFAQLTKTANAFGTLHASVRNLTLDAEGTTNPTSHALALYGRGIHLEHLVVQHSAGDAITLDWGGQQKASVADDDLEDSLNDVREYFGGGDGLVLRGPSDAILSAVVVHNNKGWGLNIQNSIHVDHINSYLNEKGGCWTHVNGGMIGSDVLCDTDLSTAGWGLLIDTTGQPSYLSSADLAGPVALELRQFGSVISGAISGSRKAAVAFHGGSANLTLNMFGNTGAWFDFASEVGNSIIMATSASAEGSLFRGKPAMGDIIFILNTPQSFPEVGYRQFGLSKFRANGYTLTFPQEDNAGSVALPTTK